MQVLCNHLHVALNSSFYYVLVSQFGIKESVELAHMRGTIRTLLFLHLP